MRATHKIIAVGIAGLSFAACGTSKVASSSTSTTFPPATTTTSTTLPPGTPVGFNASKTEFVLPHNLGYLPAPELALAKADPAYASGLANAVDWTKIQGSIGDSSTGSPLPSVSTWFYAPNDGVVDVSGAKDYALEWNSIVANISGPGGVEVLHSTPIVVQDSTLHALLGASTSLMKDDVPIGDQFITASKLEIQAAPVGTLRIKGSNTPAFCVPTPESLLRGGKVSRKSYLAGMTAGPSTVFAAPAGSSGDGGTYFYDKGASSCNGFS